MTPTSAKVTNEWRGCQENQLNIKLCWQKGQFQNGINDSNQLSYKIAKICGLKIQNMTRTRPFTLYRLPIHEAVRPQGVEQGIRGLPKER